MDRQRDVELVWTTPNAEELIVRMARVSAPRNEGNMITAPRLLKHLIVHEHWSPFEMANMCVEINTTRMISQQIIRHRSFSFQEFSQRYANVNSINRTELPQLRSQDHKNRQNSIDDLVERIGPKKLADLYRRAQSQLEDAEHLYQEMVSLGVAKECARGILPLCSSTRLYMNGTLRSWIHWTMLRSANGTQLEHQEIALKVKAIFENRFPVISEAVWRTEE